MQLRRRSIRLQEYDYRQNGAYFITICTHNRVELFGTIAEQDIRLNDWGKIAEMCWQEIPEHFPRVELDEFVFMPNHLHGIIVLADNVGARHVVPLQGEEFGKPTSGSVATIVRSFKAAVSKRIRKSSRLADERIWQRNYYEHVIRDEKSLNSIRQYIQANPANWESDVENPLRKK